MSSAEKQDSPVTPKNLVSVTSGKLQIVFLNEVNLFFLYSKIPICHQHLLRRSSSLNSFLKYIHESGSCFLIYLVLKAVCFPSRNNTKFDISVIPEMIMEVIHAPDSTKASNPDCILVVFLKSRHYIYITNFTKSRFSEVTHMSLNVA